MTFTVFLTEQKIKPHQVTTLHLLCGFVYLVSGTILAIFNETARLWGVLLLCAGLALLFVAVGRNKWLTQPTINRLFRFLEGGVAATVFIYALVNGWKFPAAIFGVLLLAVAFSIFWERPSEARLSVSFDNDGIRFPITARGRQIKWWEVDRVLLAHGTLSIDLLDNRLFQWTVNTPDFSTDIFTTYCNAQIEQAMAQRQKNSW
ncbi:MAG: hypothetical protein EBZ77_12105 [Chitinophagia bacterium]|nr:hypothetical protein [Chitinophagia bacterium]